MRLILTVMVFFACVVGAFAQDKAPIIGNGSMPVVLQGCLTCGPEQPAIHIGEVGINFTLEDLEKYWLPRWKREGVHIGNNLYFPCDAWTYVDDKTGESKFVILVIWENSVIVNGCPKKP